VVLKKGAVKKIFTFPGSLPIRKTDVGTGSRTAQGPLSDPREKEEMQDKEKGIQGFTEEY